MLAFKREAVALVVLAFYFLVLDQQTQESRLQQLLLLLQIALRKTRHVTRAWSWPRNQFWFKTLLNRNFVEEWWKENFRISRRMLEYIVRLVGPDLAKKDTRLRECLLVNKRVAVVLWRLVIGDTYRSMGLQFGIGRFTAMLLKADFCKAIAKRAPQFIKFPETEEELT